MKFIGTCLAIMAVAACTATAWSASPYIGYVYPAGGQQGTIVRIQVGGQRLAGIRAIRISGTGVSASFVSFEGAGGPLNAAQRELLKQRIQGLTAKRSTSAQNKPAQPTTPPKQTNAPTAIFPADPKTVTLPDLPDLRNLEEKTPKQLRQIAEKYLDIRKRTKPPIAETVTLDVTIAPDAVPGDREIRLQTPSGLTNPLIFQVGALPEMREIDRSALDAVAPPPANAPVVLNGQILPGEVDRFSLKLRGGQHLVFAAHARHLIPYLADAVPGWCQAILTLYDANGKEVAYADDNSFDPDPILACTVPQDGDYVLAVRDALYRGREDFVYRVAIRGAAPGESPLPFLPLGRVSPAGIPATVNPQLPYVDSRLPLCAAIEPNDKNAQKIAWPQLVKGCIEQPGDIDRFQFTGKAGETVIAEVYARRLGSPMDALLRVSDAAGNVLAWNDDFKHEEMGLVTHHADAYVSVKLPADGVYSVQVSDTQRHGSNAYQYYLRVGPPQADFTLRMTPSNVNVPAGGKTTITVYAFRKDGWHGDIEVTLKDAPTGFSLSGGRIPADEDSVTMTLTAPQGRIVQVIPLRLEGHAQIAGESVRRPVVPSERKMQAFASYHLVPAQELLVTVTRR